MASTESKWLNLYVFISKQLAVKKINKQLSKSKQKDKKMSSIVSKFREMYHEYFSQLKTPSSIGKS